jgi:AP-1 complex subunit beta-1
MDNPDVRDRGFIYWRLLSASPEKAQQIVLAQRPTIVDDTNRTEPALLCDLISNLASLTSVYHRRPHTFVDRRRTKAPIEAVERDDDGAQVRYTNFSEQKYV